MDLLESGTDDKLLNSVCDAIDLICDQPGDRRARAEQLRTTSGTPVWKVPIRTAVEATVSADYRDALAKLDATRKHRAGRSAQLEATQAELLKLSQRLGQLESARVADATARDTAVADRDVAAARFRQLATGVFAIDSQLGASPGTGTVRGALDAARHVAAAWPNAPYEATDLGNALHRVSEAFRSAAGKLSARADLNLEADGDVQVFTAVIDGVRVGADRRHCPPQTARQRGSVGRCQRPGCSTAGSTPIPTPTVRLSCRKSAFRSASPGPSGATARRDRPACASVGSRGWARRTASSSCRSP